jgi:hypothetical protein
MQPRPLTVAALIGILSGIPVVAREEFATAKEAEGMVGRAVAHIKAAAPRKPIQTSPARGPASQIGTSTSGSMTPRVAFSPTARTPGWWARS